MATRRGRGRVVDALPRRARDLGQGQVFALGLGVAIAVGSTMVGLTWASGEKSPPPAVRSSPVPSTVPGSCTMLVGGRAIAMDVDRARTMTMVAGVATQVDAVPAQAARALDLALTEPTHYLPTVNATLRLLAREDATPPTPESLAVLAAMAQPAALTCIFEPADAKAEKKGKSGLTPRAESVRSGVVDAFGAMKTGDGNSGRGVEISVKDGTKVDRSTGWTMANWLVARGANYGLNNVTFDDHTWQPASGWKAKPVPSAAPAGDTEVEKAAQKAAEKAEAARQRDAVLVVVEKGR
ncbi:MAG: hypothetical protein ACT4QG_02185 [Sporichthyaceae bacterium]